MKLTARLGLAKKRSACLGDVLANLVRGTFGSDYRRMKVIRERDVSLQKIIVCSIKNAVYDSKVSRHSSKV